MTDDGYEEIQYDKTTSIDPLTLIYEVKKYPALYNKQSEENDVGRSKEEIWELIHAVLFPNYQELSEEIKDVIKITVRKRWKSLRDALVKDHRLRGEDPAYREQKMMSPTVKHMQFLTPFIKYPRKKQTEAQDDNYSPDFCKLMDDSTIDLTYAEDQEDSYSQIDDDMVATEAFYPSIHLTTPEVESEAVEWGEGACIPAPDAYNQETLKYTIREVEEEEIRDGYKIVEEMPSVQKRKRTDSEEDLHLKLSELIDRCNEESQDEDRMFLLSLLSDFKRVPVSKKLKVKSTFVKALYDALD